MTPSTISLRQILFLPIVLLLLASSGAAQSRLKLEDAPTFRLRARVVSVGRQKPEVQQKFPVRFSVPGQAVTAAGDGWSPWLAFGTPQAEATLKGYPAIYLKGYPVVVKLHIGGVVDPTQIEAELQFDGSEAVVKLSAELFGPTLGILLWRDEPKRPQAATMAAYNRRYWKALEAVPIPPAQRPKQFPIVDRFIGGDDDRRDWQEGIDQLARAGCTALMLPPSRPLRNLLLKAGLRRTAWAVYNPPGYAFAFDPKVTPEAVTQWAAQQAQPYRASGYSPEDMALFAMSDEPGWYYPKMLHTLADSPAGMTRFRDYLRAQGLQPADLGAKGWEDVRPLGRSQAKELPSRRLFYWTTRFFAYDSARHFAACTRALEQVFYPGVPVLTNWNFFAGRSYVPGPVANNPDKRSPDAAMGGHDWFEFGRLRGGTMLWTEDWFPDNMAYQWSFYCTKLRCAAAKGGVQFGGYVIPRTAGDRPDGLVQKVLCVVGSGGKAVKYFVFGPEYNFPGNCYSERAQVLPQMAEAHRMIGAAEELLWPGQRPRPEVAILFPRSAQVWDAREMPIAKGIRDATNTNLNGSTVDYLAAVFDLYLALQHANIPVDLVEEEDLSLQGLKPYRVVYATAPNIPAEGQRGLADWVRAGGTLVTVTGAGTCDRYDEPCARLSDLTGIREQPRARLLVANARALKPAGKGRGGQGEFTAIGVRGVLAGPTEGVEATFADGAPAIVRRTVAKGQVVHFAWLPGLSYWYSSNTTKDRLPVGFAEAIRRWIVYPTALAKVRLPTIVNHALVEAPVLVSKEGAALTLLNWTGAALAEVKVQARLPFSVRRVDSVQRGQLTFTQSAEGVTFTLPLGAADIVMLRP